MRMKRVMMFFSAIWVTLIANSLPVYAQAPRTWVSGVGDDANPCSRTAPCKTFAGAISKTAAGGEINVLDPGAFGAVTITKSISIIAEGTIAGVLAGGTNGIVVNAAATDVVVLRGLDIEGIGTGLNGINFLAGGQLHVENCIINNFTLMGINFAPSVASQLFVKDSVIRNNDGAAGGGIDVKPGAAVSANAVIDNVRLEHNLFGIRAQDRGNVTVYRSTAAGNINAGFIVLTSSQNGRMNIYDSVSTFNGFGITANGPAALVRISNTAITQNGTGISPVGGGLVATFGNNKNAGNTADGAPNGGSIAQQ